MGQSEPHGETVKLIKDLLVLVGVFAIFYWLVMSKKSPLKNPVRVGRQTKNTLVRIGQNTDGSYYWQLLRKRGKKHGPYASADEAACAARGNGYKVLG